jgi:hypothetical protein
MTKYFCLILFFVVFSNVQAQQSLDSMRMVLPMGINGDELISKIQLNRDKSILRIETDRQSVVFKMNTAKQLPAEITQFEAMYTAKELNLKFKEPSDHSTIIAGNVSFDNGYSRTLDSVSISKKFTILRNDNVMTLKSSKSKICSQIQLNGLSNFRLFQCQYFKCKEYYFIIPWNFGSIQNSIVVINTKNKTLLEYGGKLLQSTGLYSELNQLVFIETKDAGDFSEHGGSGGFYFEILNPSISKSKTEYGCHNPNYFNDSLIPFYSIDYKFLIQPEHIENGGVKCRVSDSNQSLVFSFIMELNNFKQINEICIDEKRIHCVISSSGSIIETFDIKNEELRKITEFPVFEFCELEQLPNGDLVIFDSYEWAAFDQSDFYIIHNYRTIEKIKIGDRQGLYGYGIYDENSLVLPDSGRIVAYNLLNRKYDVILDGALDSDFFSYDRTISALLFYKESEQAIQVLEIKNRKLVYTLYPLLNNNYFVKIPNSPYYMCSKDASKMLHYVTPSLKVIGFDQLDPIYNRPDIVLDSIGKFFGSADQELVASYRLAWEKRVERLGLKKELLATGEIAVPNAEIANAEQIEYENKDGKLIVHLKANDPKHSLQRYNVLVNEVPVYGSEGISIAGLNTHTWERTDTITLSKGSNKIQLSVINELGLENFKYPTYVNYSPMEELASKTVFIGIGVNHFQESAHNLKYCVKDVQDLANEFASKQTLVDTLLLTNKEVTRESVLALRDYLMNNTTVSDKVIISCSSHGLLDDSLNFYLAMHDVDFRNPKARGLKYEELESLLDGIPARQKLLLLDACNSGENDKTELLKLELSSMEQASYTNAEITAQIGTKKGVLIEMEEENQTNFMKMNELFINVRNNTGSVIISAAGGQQSALEAIEVDGNIIENGAFTFSVLEYLKQREGDKIKVTELKKYTEKRVEEITGGKQKPTSRQETMEVDWSVR